MAKRKCVICGNSIEATDKTIPYKGRFAHLTCFNNAVKMASSERNQKIETTKKTPKKAVKAPMEMKGQVSEEEYEEKQEYFQTLKKLLGTSTLTAKIYRLTSDYLKQYPNFTYKGMTNALNYYYVITEHAPKGDCVGIIPYCYGDAERYYESLERIKEENQDIDPEQMYQTKRYRYERHTSKKPLLDITNIE